MQTGFHEIIKTSSVIADSDKVDIDILKKND